MIRMKGANLTPAPPAVEEEAAIAPVDEVPIPEEEVPTNLPMMGGQVDPMVAGYKNPEFGPFECGACHFFEDNSCVIVSGPIDPKGLCNLFTPIQQSETELPIEAEEPEPEEAA